MEQIVYLKSHSSEDSVLCCIFNCLLVIIIFLPACLIKKGSFSSSLYEEEHFISRMCDYLSNLVSFRWHFNNWNHFLLICWHSLHFSIEGFQLPLRALLYLALWLLVSLSRTVSHTIWSYGDLKHDRKCVNIADVWAAGLPLRWALQGR